MASPNSEESFKIDLRSKQSFASVAKIDPPIFDSADDKKVFNDPVHGHIELPPLCVKIVDTPQFQRLRYLKQLGGVYYVYPGASHNRFEHSIGVCHLAGLLLKEIKSNQYNELFRDGSITNDDIICVEIAALCHDLGHGPLSHLFENHVLPHFQEPGTARWKHEQGSVEMFEYLIEDVATKIEQGKATKFTSDDVAFLRKNKQFIKDLIYGNPTEDIKKNPKRRFLYEIVANKSTEIDVDKFDYFARDSLHLGLKNNFDHTRFLKFARVCKGVDPAGLYHICVRDKEAAILYDLFHTRYTLHRRAYQHKVARIVEYMFAEALIEVNDVIELDGKTAGIKSISDSIHCMAAFMRLDDTIFRQIENIIPSKLEDPDKKTRVERAQKILERIQTRQLYKCIGWATTADKELDAVEKIREDIVGFLGEDWKNDIVVLPGRFDYGSKKKNPIQECLVYRKNDPHRTALTFSDVKVPKMDLPSEYQECFVHVYCKRNDIQSLESAKDGFISYCKQESLTIQG